MSAYYSSADKIEVEEFLSSNSATNDIKNYKICEYKTYSINVKNSVSTFAFNYPQIDPYWRDNFKELEIF